MSSFVFPWRCDVDGREFSFLVCLLASTPLGRKPAIRVLGMTKDFQPEKPEETLRMLREGVGIQEVAATRHESRSISPRPAKAMPPQCDDGEHSTEPLESMPAPISAEQRDEEVRSAMLKLLSTVWPDGQRLFYILKSSASREELRAYIIKCGCEVVAHHPDKDDFLQFKVAGWQEDKFNIRHQLGGFWFSVTDASFPEEWLGGLVRHLINFEHGGRMPLPVEVSGQFQEHDRCPKCGSNRTHFRSSTPQSMGGDGRIRYECQECRHVYSLGE